jgi:hypothetical protein
MTDVIIPARRRRHSGATNPPLHLHPKTIVGIDITRPKSTPAHERPLQRRRQHSPDIGSELEYNTEVKRELYISDSSSTSGSSASPPPVKRARKTFSHVICTSHRTQNSNMPIPANPAMLPVQAHVPRGGVASTQRRLFVVLEQACLESYRITGGAKGKGGRGEADVKYTLLNCDDHQGILAKTGRDIADARPDITHQVCNCLFHFSCFIDLIIISVSADPSRFTIKQSWPTPGLYPHCKRRSYRGQPSCKNPKDVQKIQWFDGYALGPLSLFPPLITFHLQSSFSTNSPYVE